MKLMTRLAVLGSSLALALTGVAPAQAARDLNYDATGDVIAENWETGSFTADGTRTEGDITSIDVLHGVSNVVVKVRFRKLSKLDQWRGADFRFYTNEELGRRVFLNWNPEAGGGLTWAFTRNDEVAVSCTGDKAAIDYAYEAITVTVPRACLSNPYWVRAGAQYYREIDHPRYFIDDANKKSGPTPVLPVLGPQVNKG